ncbi:MAG: RNase adapter RapZ [Acidobacteriota bacterium]|nr:RNase adapter RapZ [Acidobacteriota bacterium]
MGDAPPEQRALTAGTARFVVLTGLSGAGKSQAINALEDLGYFCVDNLPTSLLPTLARFAESDGARVTPTAVVVDMRDPAFLDEFPRALASLRRRQSLGTLLIFLEADDNALVQRFSETRRPHPLAADQTVLEGIRKERTALARVKQMADTVFDTSQLNVHELRRAFRDLPRVGQDKPLVVTVLSFGYKHGIPLEADLMFDARCLPNPHFVPALRPLTGRDRAVRDYLGAAEATGLFIDKTADLLRFLIPQYAAEGKSYLTVAVGCTGGRHRSVMVAEAFRRRLDGLDGVRLRLEHRDAFSE